MHGALQHRRAAIAQRQAADQERQLGAWAARYDGPMHANLFTLLMLLSTAVLMVSVAKRFKLPTILAYLLIGIAVGPHGLAWMAESATVSEAAEFGIVFLMFTIGLEFSVQKLVAMRKLVFGLGSQPDAADRRGHRAGDLVGLWTGLAQWCGCGVGGGHVVHRHRGAHVVRAF